MRFLLAALLVYYVPSVEAPVMRQPDMEFVLDEVARIEGGVADIPGDAGGKTYWGLSQFVRDEYERDFGPWPPRSQDEARAFFAKWWQESELEELPISDRMAAMLFLFRVHKNEREMARLLQVALTLTGEPVKVDGVIGPKTKRALMYASEERLYEAFLAAASGWYLRGSNWDRFGEAFLSHRLRVEVGD